MLTIKSEAEQSPVSGVRSDAYSYWFKILMVLTMLIETPACASEKVTACKGDFLCVVCAPKMSKGLRETAQNTSDCNPFDGYSCHIYCWAWVPFSVWGLYGCGFLICVGDGSRSPGFLFSRLVGVFFGIGSGYNMTFEPCPC